MTTRKEQFNKVGKELYETLSQMVGVIDTPKPPFISRGHKNRLYSVWRLRGWDITIYDSEGVFNIYFTYNEHRLRYEAFMKNCNKAQGQQLQNRFIYYMREYDDFKISQRAIAEVKRKSGFWYKLNQHFRNLFLN